MCDCVFAFAFPKVVNTNNKRKRGRSFACQVTHTGFNHFCECKHTIHHSTFNTTQQINHRHFSSKLCLCLRPLAVALQWPLRISPTHTLWITEKKLVSFSILQIGIAGTKLVAVKHHHTLILHSNKASKAERRVEWSEGVQMWYVNSEKKEMKRKDETNCEPPHSQLPHT